MVFQSKKLFAFCQKNQNPSNFIIQTNFNSRIAIFLPVMIKLKSILESYLSVKPELVKVFFNKVQIKNYSKGEILINAGDVNRNMYYLQKGTIRAFSLNKNNERITAWFKTESNFFISMNAYINGAPYDVSIEAVDDVTVYFADKSFADKMMNKHQFIAKYYTSEIEKVFIFLEKMIIDFQKKTATERYVDLLNDFPSILNIAPLSYIASYLGITQATLSRIRSSLSSNTKKINS